MQSIEKLDDIFHPSQTHTCTQTQTHRHTQAHVDTHVHRNARTQTRAHADTHMCAHRERCTGTCEHARAHTCTPAHGQPHTHTHARTHAEGRVSVAFSSASARPLSPVRQPKAPALQTDNRASCSLTYSGTRSACSGSGTVSGRVKARCGSPMPCARPTPPPGTGSVTDICGRPEPPGLGPGALGGQLGCAPGPKAGILGPSRP